MIICILVVGLVTGYFLGKYYIKNRVTVYHGGDSNYIKKQIFYCSKTKKYYKFTPIPYVCPPMYANALKQTSSHQKRQ